MLAILASVYRSMLPIPIPDYCETSSVVVVKQTSETSEVVTQNNDTHWPEDEPGLNVETPPG